MKTLCLGIFITLVYQVFGQINSIEKYLYVDSISQYGEGFMIYTKDLEKNNTQRIYSHNYFNSGLSKIYEMHDTIEILSGHSYLFYCDSSSFLPCDKIILQTGRTVYWSSKDGKFDDIPYSTRNTIGQYILSDRDFQRRNELNFRYEMLKEKENRLLNGNIRNRLYYHVFWKHQDEFKELCIYLDYYNNLNNIAKSDNIYRLKLIRQHHRNGGI